MCDQLAAQYSIHLSQKADLKGQWIQNTRSLLQAYDQQDWNQVQRDVQWSPGLHCPLCYSFKSPCGCFIFLFPKLRCAHTWAQVPARTILCTAGHHAQGDCGQRRRRPPHARLAAPLARELPDSMPDSWLCIDFLHIEPSGCFIPNSIPI